MALEGAGFFLEGIFVPVLEGTGVDGGPGVVGGVVPDGAVVAGTVVAASVGALVVTLLADAGIVNWVTGVGLASRLIAAVGVGIPLELSGEPGGPAVVGAVGETGAVVAWTG